MVYVTPGPLMPDPPRPEYNVRSVPLLRTPGNQYYFSFLLLFSKNCTYGNNQVLQLLTVTIHPTIMHCWRFYFLSNTVISIAFLAIQFTLSYHKRNRRNCVTIKNKAYGYGELPSFAV